LLQTHLANPIPFDLLLEEIRRQLLALMTA
jgi:hypothetical protein